MARSGHDLGLRVWLSHSMKRLLVIVITLGAAAVLFAEKPVEAPKSPSIVAAARAQIGQTVRYDPSYQSLAYPNGDVPIEAGVCTDVVIRAMRTGHKLDLQKLVHEDMKRNFSQYPKIWKLKRPDKNIDHRRVPNLQVFFKRRGWELPLTKDPKNYQPGDLVTCLVPPALPHIMIVSDRTTSNGRPLIIHNIGSGAQEEDQLFNFKLTGHYRLKLEE